MSKHAIAHYALPGHARIEADLRPSPQTPHNPPRLVLVRGLPGSGKSTLARQLTEAVTYEHLEADQFFMKSGRYQYDASRIRDAHLWCQSQTRDALKAGRRVIVANTFTRIAELAPYLGLCDDVVVLHATGTWPNVHGVPAEMIRRMADRWECFSIHDHRDVSRNAATRPRRCARRGGRTDEGMATRLPTDGRNRGWHGS